MKYEIKYSVDKCRINERRSRYEFIKTRLFQIDREMAALTFDRTVGLYANKIDRYEYLLQIIGMVPEKCKEEINFELETLYGDIYNISPNSNIYKYRLLRDEYNTLKNSLGDYFQGVNIELRNELEKLVLPRIYVYQGHDEKFKHIISSDNVSYSEIKGRHAIIYPFYDIKSNREFRHFYNKTSFKYLEMLSQDYSYSFKNKNLRKVKIISNYY